MANPKNSAGKVNVKKGSRGTQPPQPSEVFTVVGDTPSNNKPTTRPAGDPKAAMTSTKPGQFPQNRTAPGKQTQQAPSTQTPHNNAG